LLNIPNSAGDTPARCPQCDSVLTIEAAPGYVIFDLETTGLYPDGCEIIQIAATRFQNGQIDSGKSFFSYCRPERPIPRFISEYTGITDRDVRNAPRPIEVLEQFSTFVGDSVLMAHNGHRFDNKFLEATCGRHGSRIRPVESIDTISLSRRLFGTTRGTGHSLDRVIQRLALADSVKIMWKRLNLDSHCTGIPRRQTFLPGLAGANAQTPQPAVGI
jgi:DNA polymerase III alpha subunit (gram-positive type)